MRGNNETNPVSYLPPSSVSDREEGDTEEIERHLLTMSWHRVSVGDGVPAMERSFICQLINRSLDSSCCREA